MTDIAQFHTARLAGRPPSEGALALYKVLFGAERGAAELAIDVQDWERYQVAPWVLRHAGNPVGVGGFRLGFGGDGLQLTFHFLPEVWGQGLASEFVQGALDHAALSLREDRMFAFVAPDNLASRRVLDKAGFHQAGFDERRGEILLRLDLCASGRRSAPPRHGGR